MLVGSASLRRWLSALAVLALGLALAPTALPTQAQSPAPLVSKLRSLIADSGLEDKVGVAVRDARSDREIFSHRKSLPMNPASNMKLVTAAGALLALGPDFTMRTGLYGEIENGGRIRQLVLRGFGDPTLRMSDLVELAEQLADRQVRSVDMVVVDGTYFDDEVLPPAFDQQPDEIASFRAPIGAVAVEQGAYTLRVMPGPEVGAKARVRLAARGYFDVENTMTTSDGGAPDVIAIQRGEGKRMKLILRGSVPTGVLGVSYRRRVEHPLYHAGYAMLEALERSGIKAGSDVELGTGPDGLPLLTSRLSPPVADIIAELGKHSDNFVAEMLLKVIGAEASRPGTSERGAEELQKVLADAGVEPSQLRIINGSGLFEGNRIAPDHLTRLLARMYRDAAVRPEYLSQLAVGGTDGTLHRRLRDLPAPRIVRAKTGTLNEVIALSGYVLGPEPEQAWAFSFLANDVYGKHYASRKLADDLVRALADGLY